MVKFNAVVNTETFLFFSTSGLNNETIVIEDDDSGSDYTDVDSDEYDDDEEYAEVVEVVEVNEGEFEDDFTDEEESDDEEESEEDHARNEDEYDDHDSFINDNTLDETEESYYEDE